MKKDINPPVTNPKETINFKKEAENFKELMGYVGKAKKNGHYIEAFIMAYQMIQEIELPRLRKMVLSRLKLTNLANEFDGENSAYHINLEYVALTHDTELFHLLEKARKVRNKLVHKLTKHNSFTESQKIAQDALKGIIYKLFVAIISRWGDCKAIPVLTLYTKGWNDCRKEGIKAIEKVLHT